MTISKKVFIIVPIVVFIGIQFYQPERINPEVTREISVPPVVFGLLRQKCYDCHSYETEWPWYADVAPVSWWIAGHVNDARAALNFSEWREYSKPEQVRLMKEILKNTDEGTMPPWHYGLMNPRSGLKLEDRKLIRSWVHSAIGAGAIDKVR